MVGRISGMTKVSDCERTLLRQTKDKRKTRHVAEIFQLREMMKLFPTGGRFISCRFTLYKRLTNNRYAEQGNKMTLLCAYDV